MKIQLESGSSSSDTHSLTQPSAALDRRYVDRPTTLAIEEAARSARTRSETTVSTPSRLVNLRLHEADLVVAKDAGPLTEPVIQPEIKDFSTDVDTAQPAPADDQFAVMRDQIASELSAPNPIDTTPPTPGYDDETRSLALSIAADYTAASLGAAATSSADHLEATDKLSAAIYEAKNANPIDEVAKTAAAAIAAVRTAKTPETVAASLDSLKHFADDLAKDTSLPELAELSTTLRNFIAIAEKSTGIKAAARLNRAAAKATKSTAKIAANKPASKAVSKASTKAKIKPAAKAATRRPAAKATTKTTAPSAARSATTTTRAARPAQPRALHTPHAIKTAPSDKNDAALRRAMRSVATMEANTKAAHRVVHRKGRAKRVLLALSCSAACVAAIVYFVSTNIPDISVRVAAMQTGIEASYPSYIPQDFSLDGISSENGKITLTFRSTDGKLFTLIEEKSSWDSTALQRNYVHETWGADYTTTHEQGITIFINGSSAAWVNGGVLYKINADNDTLSKKQLRNIVTSM